VPFSFYCSPFDFRAAATDGYIMNAAQTAASDMILAHHSAVILGPTAPAPATRGAETAPKVGLGGCVGRGLGG
jgi:hypothetical protein